MLASADSNAGVGLLLLAALMLVLIFDSWPQPLLKARRWVVLLAAVGELLLMIRLSL